MTEPSQKSLEEAYCALTGEEPSRYLAIRPDEQMRRVAIALDKARQPQWQDISTAPKDGTKILACRAGENWNCQVVWLEWAQQWRCATSCEYEIPDLTHWMPQISPPSRPPIMSEDIGP